MLQQELRHRAGGALVVVVDAGDAVHLLPHEHCRHLQRRKRLTVVSREHGGHQNDAVHAAAAENLQIFQLLLHPVVGVGQEQPVALGFQHLGDPRHHAADGF